MQLKASGILQLQEVSSFFVGVMSSLLDANSNGKQRNNQTETTAAVNLCTHMQLAAFFAIPHCCMLPPFWGVFPQCCESLQAQVQLQHVACATMMSNKICSCRSRVVGNLGGWGIQTEIFLPRLGCHQVLSTCWKNWKKVIWNPMAMFGQENCCLDR